MNEAGTLAPEISRSTAHAKMATRTKVYLFLLAFTLPMDLFRPTAFLLREAGAKPAIPLMVAGAAWIIRRHWAELLFVCPKLWRTILLLCGAVALLSTFAFITNVGLEISYWGGLRNPWTQFVSQGALFVIVAPVLIAHAWLFSKSEVQVAFLRMLPTVTALHLAAIAGEWCGILQSDFFPLALFRGVRYSWPKTVRLHD